jgi:Family of unknown function (DUF5670)
MNTLMMKQTKGSSMFFLILFVVLLLAWIFGFAVFHIAGAALHLLLVLAVVSLIVHLVRGGTRATPVA